MIYTSAFYISPSGRLAPFGLGFALGSYLLAYARRQNYICRLKLGSGIYRVPENPPYGKLVWVIKGECLLTCANKTYIKVLKIKIVTHYVALIRLVLSTTKSIKVFLIKKGFSATCYVLKRCIVFHPHECITSMSVSLARVHHKHERLKYRRTKLSLRN